MASLKDYTSKSAKNYDVQSNSPVIYNITNIKTGHIYIGGTNNLTKRRSQHFKDLQRNKHHSTSLQIAYNKYGEEYFELDILQTVDDKKNLRFYEQKWLDLLKPFDKRHGYNSDSCSEGTKGRLFSSETRKKMSISISNSKTELVRKNTSDTMKRIGIKIPNFHHIKTDLDKFPNQRLTGNQVREIWNLYKSGIHKIDIANRFCVSKSHINNIISGRSWGHLKNI